MRPLRYTLLLLTLLAVPGARAQFTNGQAAAAVLGQSSFATNTSGLSATQMNQPAGVALDPTTGKLFVADTDNHRVLRFASAAAFTSGAAAEAVLGQPDFTTIVTPLYTTQTEMRTPVSVAVDGAGRLYVADTGNHRVLRFDGAATKANGAPADGVLGQPRFTTGSTATTQTGMIFPVSVAVDVTGRLYVADSGNNRVLRFDGAAVKANGASADGVLGQPNFTTNGVTTTQSGMNRPCGLVVDASGNLYVADNNNRRVLRFASAAAKANGAPADGVLGQPNFTTSLPAVSQTGMSLPFGLAVDTAGRLYVADEVNHRVLRFDGAATKANGAPADGVLGQPNFTTNVAATTQSGMRYPYGVAVDAAGRLYVAEKENNRVLRFEPATPVNATPAAAVLGQPDFTTNTPGLSATQMKAPFDVAVDPATGKLFVADFGNNRVLRFASAAAFTNGAAAEAVLGQPDFTTNTAATTQAGMSYPIGVAIDGAGRLYVADQGNNRVLRFDGAATKASGAPADAVLGQPGFTTKTQATSASGMYYPVGVAVDAAGHLYVADNQNHRVLRFGSAGTAASEPETFGQREAFVLTAPHPNPFAAAARLSLTVRQTQRVQAELFDALGRRMAVLYDGEAEAGHVHPLAVDGRALPTGVYVVRVRGERFTATQTLTRAR